jgi:hypothetical protein
MKILFKVIITSIFCVFISSSSWASLITYEFTGHITSSSFWNYNGEYVDVGCNVGDFFSGEFTYSTDPLYVNISPQYMNYTGPDFHMVWHLTYTGDFPYSYPSEVYQTQDVVPVYQMKVDKETNTVTLGIMGGSGYYSLKFVDTPLSNVFDNSPPAIFPSASEWDTMSLGFFYEDWGGRSSLTYSGGAVGQIDTLTPIPEPATMLLLGFGLVGLTGFRKRFFKK